MWYHRSGRCSSSARFAAAALLCCSLVDLPVPAKAASAYLEAAQNYVSKGNFKAAEIELRNAQREAPQDPRIRAMLANVYLRLRNFAVSEREARAARDLKGAEADYLIPLAEAMLGQGKFADLMAEVKPGARQPALESKVRALLSTAALGLHDRDKAQALLRDAVSLDDSTPDAKIALAQLLVGSNVSEAEAIVDAILAANQRVAGALAIKGEILATRGDADDALKHFAEALAIEPSNITARLARANVNLSRGDYAAVDADLDPVLKRSPDNFIANYLRAWASFKKRDFAAADKTLEGISPSFAYMAEGFYMQAATKYELGQSGRAADAIAKYVARVPQNPQGVRLAAMIAMQRKTPDVAIRYLTAYLAKFTPDPATLTLLGNIYAKTGKSTLALEQYQRAAALDPESLPLKTIVAASQIETGAGRKGLDELEAVFATKAGVTVAGPTLALTELRHGHVDRAAEVAEKLLKQDPDSALYQNLLGLARIAQKDYPAAETVLKKLVDRNPDFLPARTNLAHAYILAGRPYDAANVYQDYLARKPDDVAALLGLADIATKQKQWDKAIEYVNKARAAAPADPTPAIKLLTLYGMRQEWTLAKALARELAAQFPSNVDILEAQARILLSTGDRDGEIDARRRAYEAAPNSAPLLTRYLRSLAAARRFTEIRTILQALLDKDPADRGVKAQLIRIEAEISGLDAGLAKARNFAKNDPSSSLYERVSADLYEGAGRRTEAITLLEKAAAARPMDNDIAVALSGLNSRAGDAAKAEAVLSDRLKKQPDNVVVRAALADLYIREKKFDLAITEETRVLAKRENDAVALNNLAWLHQRMGDLAKAREFAEKAAAIAPKSGAVADTLGWVLLAQGDVEKALPRLEAANAAMPDNPEINYHLAVALERAGRAADARVILEKLIGSGESFSSKAEALKLLEELKRG